MASEPTLYYTSSHLVYLYMFSASVTFNACVLLYGGTHRLLHVLSTRWRSRRLPLCPQMTWEDVGSDTREDVSKLVAYSLSGVVVTMMAVGVLISTDVAKQPFLYHGDKEAILVVCSATVGRYLFLLALDIYCHYISPHDRYITCLHHVATVSSFVAVTSYGMNLFLPLVLLFMEMDHFVHLIVQLLQRKKSSSPSTIHLLNITGLILALCFRIALPIAVTTVAITRQSPFKMTAAPLGFLCFGLLFFAVFNIWMIRNWAVSVFRRSQRSEVLHCLGALVDTEKIQNDLTQRRRSANDNDNSLLLAQVTKLNNVHTVTNLQSNFSNQLWSKDINTVSQIGGTKASTEEIDHRQFSTENNV